MFQFARLKQNAIRRQKLSIPFVRPEILGNIGAFTMFSMSKVPIPGCIGWKKDWLWINSYENTIFLHPYPYTPINIH